MTEVLLRLTDLKVYYPLRTSAFRLQKQYVKAVDGVSFDVYKGEAFGVVGESGCGKSTLGHAVVGLLEPHAGTISFAGKTISGHKRDLNLASKMQIIFQDPFSSLDPRFTVGRCIEEPLLVHRQGGSEERRQQVLRLMHDVGLSADSITKYPHEFSGGQRQRIGVARALALKPSLIVCDEPVSALDVSIQAQILNMMQDLQEQYQLTYLFVSHNLSVVEHLCDRIAVMYLGNLVELAGKEQLFHNPVHPYTQALLDAIPVPDPKRRGRGKILSGDVPSPINPPGGCCFHTRCPYAMPKCAQVKPVTVQVEAGHSAACHLLPE